MLLDILCSQQKPLLPLFLLLSFIMFPLRIPFSQSLLPDAPALVLVHFELLLMVSKEINLLGFSE